MIEDVRKLTALAKRAEPYLVGHESRSGKPLGAELVAAGLAVARWLGPDPTELEARLAEKIADTKRKLEAMDRWTEELERRMKAADERLQGQILNLERRVGNVEDDVSRLG